MLIIRLKVIRQEFPKIQMISDAPAWSSAFRRRSLIRFNQRVNAELQILTHLESDIASAPLKLLPDYTEE
jgi:hypothetical protein